MANTYSRLVFTVWQIPQERSNELEPNVFTKLEMQREKKKVYYWPPFVHTKKKTLKWNSSTLCLEPRSIKRSRDVSSQSSHNQCAKGKPQSIKNDISLSINQRGLLATHIFGQIQNFNVSENWSLSDIEQPPQKYSCKTQRVVFDNVRLAPAKPKRGAMFFGDTCTVYK